MCTVFDTVPLESVQHVRSVSSVLEAKSSGCASSQPPLARAGRDVGKRGHGNAARSNKRSVLRKQEPKKNVRCLSKDELGFRLFKKREKKRFSLEASDEEIRKIWTAKSGATEWCGDTASVAVAATGVQALGTSPAAAGGVGGG